MSTEKMLIDAKTLRANQTEAEQRLWYHLRAHRFMDLKLSAKTHGSLYRGLYLRGTAVDY